MSHIETIKVNLSIDTDEFQNSLNELNNTMLSMGIESTQLVYDYWLYQIGECKVDGIETWIDFADEDIEYLATSFGFIIYKIQRELWIAELNLIRESGKSWFSKFACILHFGKKEYYKKLKFINSITRLQPK